MKTEIITIGDEILSGKIVNTNAAWMGQQLNAAGIGVDCVTSVPDSGERILSALGDAVKRVDLVLITGGLGPTRDDVTKKALCDFFHSELVFDQDAFDDVKRFIAARRISENELQRAQAMVLRDCLVLRNSIGTAPGMWFEKEGKVVVAMPGVPAEMKKMMLEKVLPKLRSAFTTGAILHRSVLVHGISESNLALKVAGWERNLPKHLKLASLPHGGYIHLRLSAFGNDEGVLDRVAGAELDKLGDLIGEYIYDSSDSTPEQLIGKTLRQKALGLAIIECGSNGALACRLTAIPENVKSIVCTAAAPSSRAVATITGTDPGIVEKCGTHSREAAEDMAARFRDRFGADMAIATSAVCESPESPSESGFLWVAISSGRQVISEQVPMAAHYVDRILFTFLRTLRKIGKAAADGHGLTRI